MVRVLIADDHQLVAFGLAALLDAEDDFDVVGLAANADDTVGAARELQPDVTVIDSALSGDGWCGRAVRAAAPETSLVMTAPAADEPTSRAAIDGGYSALVLKSSRPDELVDAVRAAAAGEAHFAPAVLVSLVTSVRSAGAPRPADNVPLTARELQILRLISDGRTTAEIVSALHLSLHTVRNHVRHLLAKLGAHSKLEAVVVAAHRGLIEVGRPV